MPNAAPGCSGASGKPEPCMLEILFKVSQRRPRAHHTILVETVSPISAAKIHTPATVDFALTCLRRSCIRRIERMVVMHALDDLRRVDDVRAIQCDEVG